MNWFAAIWLLLRQLNSKLDTEKKKICLHKNPNKSNGLLSLNNIFLTQDIVNTVLNTIVNVLFLYTHIKNFM